MPKPKYYSRIAITLPEQDLAAADRLARTLDRSRSWVIAEAVRRFAAAGAVSGSATAPAQRVAEPATTYGTQPIPQSGLGPYRAEQLRRDMELTPEQRVHRAEETLRNSGNLRRPKGPGLLAFDRYEEFLDWKRTRAALR